MTNSEFFHRSWYPTVGGKTEINLKPGTMLNVDFDFRMLIHKRILPIAKLDFLRSKRYHTPIKINILIS